MEEQIENIAQAQAEDQQHIPTPAGLVPPSVIGRALTSGGNERHSIERIVAFFQKGPTGSAAASFMAKEFGVGGRGVTIAKQEYSLWFDREGFRIAPGRSAFGPGSTLVTWVNAAAMTSNLLRGGMFATQDKIDAARDNEFQELSERLWYLRRDFSEDAVKRGCLPAIAEAYAEPGFPDGTKAIEKVLRDPHEREKLVEDMRIFNTAYKDNPELLRFRQALSPVVLASRIEDMDRPVTPFQSQEGFAPAKASFITEDEIDQLLLRGGNVSGEKFRIYSYFVQGHDPKECAKFLKESCGEGGYCRQGYSENYGTKGISLTREDEDSGFKGYDTIHLSWNQVQKRVRTLIEQGRYLTDSERESLPERDKDLIARRLYHFFSHVPDCQHWPFAEGVDAEEGAKQIRAMLEEPQMVTDLFHTMLNDFSTVRPDAKGYTGMMFAIRDMGAFVRGESPMFSPLPESALQAEREIRERSQKKEQATEKDTVPDVPETPGEGFDDLAAVARALASKRKPEAGIQEDGQVSLFAPRALADAEPQERREITDMDLDHFLIEDLGDPERKQRLYALFTGDLPDAMLVQKLEQEYSRSRHGNAEGGFCTLADGTRGYAYFAKELRLSPRPEGEMRRVSFEEMAAHIRQLIQEDRYLSPEELEQVQQGHMALESEEVKPEIQHTAGHSNQATVTAEEAPLSTDSPERFEIVRLWGENGPFGIYDNALERFYEEGNRILQFVERGSAENYLANIHRITGLAVPPETSAEWVVTPVTLYETALQILDRAIGNSNLSRHLRDRDLEYKEAADALNAELPELMEAARGYPDIFVAFQALPRFREWLVEDILERHYQDVITDPRLAPERYAGSPDAPDWARKNPPVDHPKQEQAAAVPTEPDFAPNVDGYLDLKTQHPDKLVGVQVGEFMMFYGKDAEEAASALGTKAPILDIPGLGQTPATGSRDAWQAVLKKLLEHGKSVVLACPDPEHGLDAPYEIIKERSAAEYIPLGMELTIDGRRMKVDSIDYTNGKVSLMDVELTMGYRYPVFREEPVAFVRTYVEDAERLEFEQTAQIEPVMEPRTSDELEEAKRLIEDFCDAEYGDGSIDFSNLEHIGVAYTTTEDEQHEILVEVDLLDFSVTQTLDGQLVEQRQYKTLRELIDNELTILDFDSLIHLEREPEELLADTPKTTQQPESAPEQIEIDGGRIEEPPAPQTPMTSRVVGQVNAGTFDVALEKLHIGPELHDFHITDDSLGAGGQKTKYQNNVAAIRTLKQIEAEGRLATPEEQEILSRYVGWGSLAPAFDERNSAWAKEFEELQALLTPEEYAAARATTLNAHYARFVP